MAADPYARGGVFMHNMAVPILTAHQPGIITTTVDLLDMRCDIPDSKADTAFSRTIRFGSMHGTDVVQRNLARLLH
jgi:hypothetical protein